MLYFNKVNRNPKTGKATLQLTTKPIVTTVKEINIPGVGPRKVSQTSTPDVKFVLKSMQDGETKEYCRINHPIWDELEKGYKMNDPVEWVDIDLNKPVINSIPVKDADGNETGEMKEEPSTTLFWGKLAV